MHIKYGKAIIQSAGIERRESKGNFGDEVAPWFRALNAK
jgi:hypothetical protein